MSRYLPDLLMYLWISLVVVVMSAALMGFADVDSYSPDDALLGHSEDIKVLRAAIQMCGGENSVATLVEDGLYQCATKRGFKTAQVSP
jgi:hypothetical protein